MLSPEELSRRIKAARELRGITQAELGEMFDAEGLNKSDPGRIERMSADVTVRRVHLDAFARHLGVPDRWLTDPDLDVVFGLAAPDGPAQGDASAALAALEEQVRLLRAETTARDAEVLTQILSLRIAIRESQPGQQP